MLELMLSRKECETISKKYMKPLKDYCKSEANLEFKGYYNKDTQDKIPTESGIYVAHAVKYTNEEHTRISHKSLVYIGKAEGTDNLKKRIGEHIDGTDAKRSNRVWMNKLKADGLDVDEIVYSYAEYDGKDIADVETALIYANEDNGIYNEKDTHGHDNENAKKLSVKCTGKKDLLKDHTPEGRLPQFLPFRGFSVG